MEDHAAVNTAFRVIKVCEHHCKSLVNIPVFYTSMNWCCRELYQAFLGSHAAKLQLERKF